MPSKATRFSYVYRCPLLKFRLPSVGCSFKPLVTESFFKLARRERVLADMVELQCHGRRKFHVLVGPSSLLATDGLIQLPPSSNASNTKYTTTL